MTGSFKQQMREIKHQINRTRRTELKNPSPSPMVWKKDGEDHINIWEQAETPLGKFLRHNSNHFIEHSLFGRFKSVENFWHFIQSVEQDDRARNMESKALRRFSHRMTSRFVPNFKAVIMDTNWQKILQYPTYAQMIRESTLPFDCYFIKEDTGLRSRPTFHKWLIMGFNEIRRALKEKDLPNFDFLMDDESKYIYEGLFNIEDVKDLSILNGKSMGLMKEVVDETVDLQNEELVTNESLDMIQLKPVTDAIASEENTLSPLAIEENTAVE